MQAQQLLSPPLPPPTQPTQPTQPPRPCRPAAALALWKKKRRGSSRVSFSKPTINSLAPPAERTLAVGNLRLAQGLFGLLDLFAQVGVLGLQALDLLGLYSLVVDKRKRMSKRGVERTRRPSGAKTAQK